MTDDARSLFCYCDSCRSDQQPQQQPLRPSAPYASVIRRPLRRQLAPEICDQPPRVLGLRGDFRSQLVHTLTQDTGALTIGLPASYGVAHSLLAQEVAAGDAPDVSGLRGTRRASAQE